MVAGWSLHGLHYLKGFFPSHHVLSLLSQFHDFPMLLILKQYNTILIQLIITAAKNISNPVDFKSDNSKYKNLNLPLQCSGTTSPNQAH